MSNELKPCPFCGGEAYIKPCEVNPHQIYACCPACCCCGDYADNNESGKALVTENWNERYGEARLETRIAELEESERDLIERVNEHRRYAKDAADRVAVLEAALREVANISHDCNMVCCRAKGIAISALEGKSNA